MRGKERFSAPENASHSLKRFSAGTTPRLKRKKILGWLFSHSDMAGTRKNSTGREVLPARPLRVA